MIMSRSKFKHILRWTFPFFLFSVVIVLLNETTADAQLSFHWSDYRKPFTQSFRVRQNKKEPVEEVFVSVDLPERFITSHEKIILVIDIESQTEDEFVHFKPYIKVNDAFFGSYKIPVDYSPNRQTRQIEIKSGHLQPGRNTLKAFYNWNKKNTYCTEYGCGFTIHKMFFKDAPSLPTPTPKPTSTPRPRKTSTPKLPTPTPTPSRTFELLHKANEYFEKRWFTTPEETNAFDLCQEVFKIDPGNQKAQELMRKIMQTYRSWGNNAYEQENYTKAATNYKKYLLVADYMINTLGDQSIKQEFEEIQDKLELSTQTPTPTATPTLTPTPTPTTPPTPTLTPTPSDMYPVIEITSTIPAEIDRDTLEIQGVVTDDSGISMVLIQTPQKFIKSFTAKEGEISNQENFSASIKLDIGRNEIKIEATDILGQTTRQVFDVSRILASTPTPTPTLTPIPIPTPIPTPMPTPTSTPSPMLTPTPTPQSETTSTPQVTNQTSSSQTDGSIDSKKLPDILSISERMYVIVIGIGNYQDDRIPNLRFIKNDAQEIYNLFLDPRYCGISEDHIELLLNQDATERNIKSVLGKWLHENVKVQDSVFIFYLGQGAFEDEESYWLTYDADIDDLYSTALSTDKIIGMLDRIQTQSVIMFFDASYNSPQTGQINQASASQIKNVWDEFSEGGRIIVSASNGDQNSEELEEEQHGVFVYYLSQGLKLDADENIDGVVALGELWDYLQTQIEEYSMKTAILQKPQLYGDLIPEISLTFNLSSLRKNYMVEIYRAGEISAEQFKKAFDLLETGEKDQILDDFLTGKISLELFKKTF